MFLVFKYTPPTDSAIPDKQWRLFTFKDKEKKDIHKIDEKDYYIIGKDEKVYIIYFKLDMQFCNQSSVLF